MITIELIIVNPDYGASTNSLDTHDHALIDKLLFVF